MTDDALVRRCLTARPPAAREAAIRELVERFHVDVFSLSVRMLRHRQDAEDVTQEVFVRVIRSLGRWDSTRPLRPWILTIAVNRCRTWLSRRGKRPDSIDYLHDLPGKPTDGPGEELTTALQEAVDELRDDYREVFVLFHELGRSYDEIAEAVGRPVGTIKTWLHRARVQVMAALRSRGLGPENDSTGEPEPTS